MKLSSYLMRLFKILNIAFYGVMGSMANKSTMFSKQSLISLLKQGPFRILFFCTKIIS